ncbi:hypothetical protein [Streptomyces albidus (ex Kaewkla and Franco 2022)]|uniref:hypothetical protein n=1 Tax=Streptomyces albidus (ex Kaewkla and Franco 2022) TaxID=722709 RepID=UPI0015EE566B|nr:hypothetical protein [Streptomyces albidus (ex Kaewkla and Franco 2022)]
MADSGNPQWHPSRQEPPHHHGKPKKSRRGRKAFWGIFGGVILAVLLVAGGCSVLFAGEPPDKPEKRRSQPEKDKGEEGPDSFSENEEHPPKDDVKLSRPVTKDEFGFKTTTLTVTVTNHSSEASDYLIDLELLNSAGNRVEETPVSTLNLEPGRTFTEKVEFTEAGKSVKAISVDRTSSAYNE